MEFKIDDQISIWYKFFVLDNLKRELLKIVVDFSAKNGVYEFL